MKDKLTKILKKTAKGVAITAGLTSLSVIGAIGTSKYLDHVNPMGGAKPGYVEVQSGDNLYDLCRKEGWSNKEISANNVQYWSPQIAPGDIVEIPQKEDNPYDELGSTKRPVYESRELAEKAQKAE